MEFYNRFRRQLISGAASIFSLALTLWLNTASGSPVVSAQDTTLLEQAYNNCLNNAESLPFVSPDISSEMCATIYGHMLPNFQKTLDSSYQLFQSEPTIFLDATLEQLKHLSTLFVTNREQLDRHNTLVATNVAKMNHLNTLVTAQASFNATTPLPILDEPSLPVLMRHAMVQELQLLYLLLKDPSLKPSPEQIDHIVSTMVGIATNLGDQLFYYDLAIKINRSEPEKNTYLTLFMLPVLWTDIIHLIDTDTDTSLTKEQRDELAPYFENMLNALTQATSGILLYLSEVQIEINNINGKSTILTLNSANDLYGDVVHQFSAKDFHPVTLDSLTFKDWAHTSVDGLTPEQQVEYIRDAHQSARTSWDKIITLFPRHNVSAYVQALSFNNTVELQKSASIQLRVGIEKGLAKTHSDWEVLFPMGGMNLMDIFEATEEPSPDLE